MGSFVHPVLREGRVIFGVDERDAGTWLRYAREDLETAERMLEGQGFALRWACYLAQQAVEKALKAVLVAEQIRFPYTHDLENLRDLLPARRHAAGAHADLAGERAADEDLAAGRSERFESDEDFLAVLDAHIEPRDADGRVS